MREPDGAPTESAVRELALRLLDRRARTSAELTAELRRRGAPDELTRGVVSRLEELGLLDDARLAESWVACRHPARSARSLTSELRRRGVDADVAAAAASNVGPGDEERAMLQFVRKRAPAMAALPGAVRERRLLAQLARRGFAPEAARRCIEEVVGRSDEDTLLAEDQ